jgi:hypothetical protein
MPEAVNCSKCISSAPCPCCGDIICCLTGYPKKCDPEHCEEFMHKDE